jgi:glycosyltransferase involved in cell wall biosynthesis
VTTTVSQLAVEEAVRRHAVPRAKIRLVPNGIRSADYVRDPGLRERTRDSLGLGDDFTWLAVGRLTEAKRHVDLLAALRIVRQAHPRARLLIAGTGPLRRALEAELAGMGLKSHATLLGERGDVRALMQAADGFVLSSAWEGLPMVMLEASASSLPIVATDVGGSRDVVEDGVTGVLTPPRAPDRLAQAMLQVMTLPGRERQAMGDQAHQRVVERFDMELVADTWESLYRPD